MDIVLDRSTDGLEFFNGIGGFAQDRREYVTFCAPASRRLLPGSTSSPIQASAFM